MLCRLAAREKGKANTSFAAIAGKGRLKAMSARHAKLMFFILIVLVTLLFFVHVPSGSFQARNGPTTPVNNLDLRVALAGLLLLLGLEGTAFSRWIAMNSVGHLSPIVLQSPAASAIGLALRC